MVDKFVFDRDADNNITGVSKVPEQLNLDFEPRVAAAAADLVLPALPKPYRRFGPRVYIAGPLHSSGNVLENISHACAAARRVLDRGMVPFIPHLFTLWSLMDRYESSRQGVSAIAEQDWLQLDMEWLGTCDALWRLPGASAGADAEEARATTLAIPVLHSYDDLIRWQTRWEDVR